MGATTSIQKAASISCILHNSRLQTLAYHTTQGIMFKTLLISGLIASGLAAPGMIFNCDDNLQGKFPWIFEAFYTQLGSDICNNMCWGAYCTRPSFGVTLDYDRYGGTGNRDSAVGRARQRSAGCLPRPNRCSVRLHQLPKGFADPLIDGRW